MLYNLSDNFAGNVIFSVAIALVLDILIIRNVYIFLISILRHVWGTYKNYFISSSNIPSQTKSAEIVNKLIENKNLSEKELKEIKEVEEDHEMTKEDVEELEVKGEDKFS